jgi:PAS domain S-box-containing protein
MAIGMARLPDGRMTDVNPAFEKLFGCSRDEVLGRSLAALDLWTQAVDCSRLVEAVSKGQRVVEFAAPLRTRGGELPEVQISAHVLDAGSERYLVTAFCVGKTVANDLPRGEARFRHTFEQAAVGMAHVAPDGRWLRFNGKFCDIVGYSEAELRHLRFQDITHPDDLRDGEERLARMLAGELPDCLIEKRYIHKSGRTVWVEVTTTLTRDEAGAPAYFIAVIEDVTERKRMEQELNDLHRRVATMTRFEVAGHTVAALAHDLNQPLNAVSSYAEAALRLLGAGNPHPEKLRQAIERSAQQAQRAGRVVHNLLAFLKHGEVAREAMHLNDLTRKVVKQAEVDAHAGVRFRLDLAPELAAVKANRLQIRKVLTNLIDNGIEAMHQAGLPSTAITVAVRTNAEQDMAQVTVTDTGPGIHPEILHRIFDTFFTTRPNGLGVGLAISRTIVESHGGKLWVESTPGAGASFHFTLPFET